MNNTTDESRLEMWVVDAQQHDDFVSAGKAWLYIAQTTFERRVLEHMPVTAFSDLGSADADGVSRIDGPFDDEQQSLAPLLSGLFVKGRPDLVVGESIGKLLASDFVYWCRRVNFAGRMPQVAIESVQPGVDAALDQIIEDDEAHAKAQGLTAGGPRWKATWNTYGRATPIEAP